MVSEKIRVMYMCIMVVKLVECQFPRSCSDDSSIASRKCCPMASDGSQCGKSSGRGSCQRTRPAASNLSSKETLPFLLDDRARWPVAFYDRACFCTEKFDGVACSKCKPGYEGDRCEKRSATKIRKNILSLSAAELKNCIEVLDKAKRVTSEDYVILTTDYDKILRGAAPVFVNASVFDVFVWMHAYATKDNFKFSRKALNSWNGSDVSLANRKELVRDLLKVDPILEEKIDVDYAHEGSGFLPWHRMYVLKWEQEIRDVVAKDPSFTLPYWDWRGSSTCDVCNDAMLGGQDPNNSSLISSGSPFSQWKVICLHEDESLLLGKQCTGAPEGPLIRNLGMYDPSRINGLPTFSDVEKVFRLGTVYDTADYDRTANNSFRNLLEGFANLATGNADFAMSHLHNAVHLYFNGTMSSVVSSANDPLFLLHHIFVDSLFEIWLNQRNQSNDQGLFNDLNKARLGHRPQDHMVPFFPLVKIKEGFKTAKDLGYEYHPRQEEMADMTDKTISDVASEKGSGDTTSAVTPNTKNSSTETSTFQIQANSVAKKTLGIPNEVSLKTKHDADGKSKKSIFDVSKNIAQAAKWRKEKLRGRLQIFSSDNQQLDKNYTLY